MNESNVFFDNSVGETDLNLSCDFHAFAKFSVTTCNYQDAHTFQKTRYSLFDFPYVPLKTKFAVLYLQTASRRRWIVWPG